MPTSAIKLQVTGLGKQKLAQLATKAKRLGVTPQRYVKELVEEDLALDQRAEQTRLSELLGPGRKVDENELDSLVDASRRRHHGRTTKKR